MARRRRIFRRRRRRAAPTRRRRRSRRSRIRKRLGKSKSAFTGLKSAIGGIVFLSQLTQADRAAGAYNVSNMGDKAKILANNLSGRILGFNVFGDVQPFSQSISLENAFNRYTGAGIAAFLYSKIPIKGLPHKAKAGSIGKVVATSGFLGGIFSGGGSPQASASPNAFITNGRQITTS